jgi:hypothetical protein
VILDLLPANEIVQCDYLGNPLRGLPLTAKATLYKGTQEITAAMEFAEAAKVEIIHYPGDIFDPMLGDFYPTLGYPVTWSLIGAPAGVTIDRYGLITAAVTAQLSDVNEITVRATYHGKPYDAIFGITKARGGVPAYPPEYTVFRFAKNTNAAAPPAYVANADNPGTNWAGTQPWLGSGEYIWQITSTWRGAIRLTDWTAPVRINGQNGNDGDAANVPKYRGVTLIADTGNTGRIRLKSGSDITMNNLDWILFMGESDWTKARLYQWQAHNNTWAKLEPAQGTLEYMEALRDITAGAPDGIFSNMFCQILFAQQAAIHTLESQLIQINNAIFGGPRFTKGADGQSVADNGVDKVGFRLRSNGVLDASGADIRNARISGTLVAGQRYDINGNQNTNYKSGFYVPGTGAADRLLKMRGAELVGSIYIGDLTHDGSQELYILSDQVAIHSQLNANRWYHRQVLESDLVNTLATLFRRSYVGKDDYRIAVRGRIGATHVYFLAYTQENETDATGTTTLVDKITFYGTSTLGDLTTLELRNPTLTPKYHNVSIMFI